MHCIVRDVLPKKTHFFFWALPKLTPPPYVPPLRAFWVTFFHLSHCLKLRETVNKATRVKTFAIRRRTPLQWHFVINLLFLCINTSFQMGKTPSQAFHQEVRCYCKKYSAQIPRKINLGGFDGGSFAAPTARPGARPTVAVTPFTAFPKWELAQPLHSKHNLHSSTSTLPIRPHPPTFLRVDSSRPQAPAAPKRPARPTPRQATTTRRHSV